MRISILDCTLRDGGYVNNFNFDNSHMKNIIHNLNYAYIDIIECGFLDANIDRETNCSRFKNISIINDLLKETDLNNSLNVAMIEYGKFDVLNLPIVNKNEMNEIKGIRYSFRKSDHLKIFDDIKIIIQKGYKLFIQPIATELYTDIEIINFIEKCNHFNIYAFYIVDTHGSMLRDNFRRLYYLIDHNLGKNIKLGFHSHNNLQLSYSNAIDFIDISIKNGREIIIDSSIYGMGRGAGNLNTELLADYLNKNHNINYNIDFLLEIVDDYLSAIKKENDWGYSLEHFLSATQNCHPNYASFLINTNNLSIVEIKKLLNKVPNREKREFEKNIIEEIYIEYKKTVSLEIKKLPDSFFNKNILMLASGSSMKKNTSNIIERISTDNLCVVSLNHIDKYIKSEFIFFSNQVRYNEFSTEITNEKLIVTSNIKIKSNHTNCYVIDFKSLYEFKTLHVDNVSILFLNLLTQNNVKNVLIAGLDGYDLNNTNNYSYQEYNRVDDKETLQNVNNTISKAIEYLTNEIHISFVTPSQFEQYIKRRIIGVIPSRYGSTRLPGKPLVDICGLPMVIHVLKRAMMSEILDDVIVATDDQKIYDLVKQYGGNAFMTSPDHPDANFRMQEVSNHITGDIFVLINGDEPLLDYQDIGKSVSGLINNSEVSASLLVTPYTERNNTSNLKMVLNKNDEVMYISRSDIPSDARIEKKPMWKGYYIVSYSKDFLDKFVELDYAPLNDRESTDQNKILENGYKIKAIKTNTNALSVDTLEDLEIVRKMMPEDKLFSIYKECKID